MASDSDEQVWANVEELSIVREEKIQTDCLVLFHQVAGSYICCPCNSSIFRNHHSKLSVSEEIETKHSWKVSLSPPQNRSVTFSGEIEIGYYALLLILFNTTLSSISCSPICLELNEIFYGTYNTLSCSAVRRRISKL